MKKIPLTQGRFALVDDDDYESLMKYSWHAAKRRGGEFCARSSIKDNKTGKFRNVYMHRFIMKSDRNEQIDHKNWNELDNRKANLRKATAAQNIIHRRKAKGKLYKYLGVWLHKQSGLWHVYIGHCGKDLFIGCFKSAKDAAIAYNIAAQLFHGEFAVLNPV